MLGEALELDVRMVILDVFKRMGERTSHQSKREKLKSKNNQLNKGWWLVRGKRLLMAVKKKKAD